MIKMSGIQNNAWRRMPTAKSEWVDVAIYTLFLIFAVLGIRYQVLLLNYKEWGDESETIVAAKMMAAGMKLYSEIFNHHGPLTFLPGLFIEKLGSFGVREHRIPIALLQIFAIIAIYKSPLIKDGVIRVCLSVVAATMILVLMPEIFGHMYKYQTIVGLLLIMVLSQYTLPAILVPTSLNQARVFLGNALITSLPFLAVTYLPISILLFLVSLRKGHLGFATAGALLGVVLNIIFLGAYGSFAGFFAFHIYLNSTVLPFYTGLEPGVELIIGAFNSVTSDFANFLFFIIMVVGAAILAIAEKTVPWRTLLLVAGVCSLLMRGGHYHGIPYFYAGFALFVPAFSRVEKLSRQSKYLLFALISVCVVKVSLILPSDRQKISSQEIPSETEFSRLVKEFTTEDDRIIAYSFQNFQYLASGRLPASGHFFYLPWQEKYNEAPKFGVVIDACQQVSDARPKVMLIDKWKVWDRFPWETYAGCIQKVLDENYIQYPGRPYYIRKDLVPEGWAIAKEDLLRKMVASSPLDSSSSIRLIFSDSAQKGDKKLVRLGIMFGTHARTNPGVAELLLTRAGGSDLKIKFLLSELLDNRYRYFDLPEDVYVSGAILSSTGGGVSTWESHAKDGDVLTCMKYIYSDGSRGFTPGCPML